MSRDDSLRLNLIAKVCEYCGIDFMARPDRIGRFCSRSHATAQRNKDEGTGLGAYERNRRYMRLKLYGLSHDAFTEMWEQQSGECLVCSTPMINGGNTRTSAHIDHDHSTGLVRGILCNSCNMGLGKFYDNPEVLEKAARYLRGEL